MKKWFLIGILALSMLFMAGCQDDAQVARHNMTKAALNFEIMRRVVFYNAINGEVIMVTEGRCDVSPGNLRVDVVCKIGPDQFIRNFYGRSDNTPYFVEQMDPIPVNLYHYRRTFKPQGILPDIDYRGSGEALLEAVAPDSSD